MFRTPDIPTAPKNEFSQKDFEEEKLWLERKNDGLILTSETEGGIFLAIGTAAFIGLILGGVVGTGISLFTGNLWHMIISYFLVFSISLYFLTGNYSTVDIDREKGLFLYDGTISLAGEYRTTRYRGPYQIVDSTLLVRFKRFLGLRSKPFIRLMTNSGYLRLNFDPENEREFLEQWQELGILNIEEMQASLNEKPTRIEEDYVVYYQKNFDRTKFKEEMKRLRELEIQQEDIDRKIKRQKLIEKSKEFVEQTDNVDEDDKIQID